MHSVGGEIPRELDIVALIEACLDLDNGVHVGISGAGSQQCCADTRLFFRAIDRRLDRRQVRVLCSL